MSVVILLGSWMMLSPIKRTAPTSLKQLEARRNAIPEASIISPTAG
jgi:hypothetical protein